MAGLMILNARLTFPVLFDAKQVNGQGDPKFSGGFLITKDHPQLAAIKAAITEAATVKWGAKAPDVLKALSAADKICLHDGDAKSDYDGYAGNFFINASNKIRPLVIGPGREALAAADGVIYSGCYVNVKLEFWAQDNQFGKRVNASLLGVQFAATGERLAGGGVASADDFEAIPQAVAEKAASTGAGAASLF